MAGLQAIATFTYERHYFDHSRMLTTFNRVACLTASVLASWPASVLTTDHPVHLAVLTVLCMSILFILAKRSQPAARSHRDHRGAYVSIPLQEIGATQLNHVGEKQRLSNHTLPTTGLLCFCVAAIVTLTGRIEVERRILLASECITGSLHVWLPFLLAVYSALRFEKRQQHTEEADDGDGLDTSAYQHAAWSLKSAVLSSPWRYVPSAFLLSLGCHLIAGMWSTSQSTQICPLISQDSLLIPRLRCMALLADTFLIVAAYELATNSVQSGDSIFPTPTSWIIVTTFTTGLWAAVATYVYRTQPENHAWLFLEPASSRMSAVIPMLFRALFLSVLAVSSLYSVSQPLAT